MLGQISRSMYSTASRLGKMPVPPIKTILPGIALASVIGLKNAVSTPFGTTIVSEEGARDLSLSASTCDIITFRQNRGHSRRSARSSKLA